MKVNIQSVKFDADKRLIEFVENKMAKLDRFAERATGADVILKLDKDHEKGNKVVTITLHVPGTDMVADDRAKSFEEAFDNALDALKKQLEKAKRSNKGLPSASIAEEEGEE
uniref:ribosome hibernation-promoting factor, HPF/YfiA family n=1 Tax=Alistipes sp. TaxID=1872444 RepID=UPI004057AEE4